MILEGTARVTAEAFFAALVENLSKAMNTHSAWVTEYIEESQQLRALAFWADGQLLTDFMIDMDGTPCGGISQIVTEMNRHLTLDILNTGRFMTMYYISIDVENKNLSWVRAGHDPAIIYDPIVDQFEELRGDGLALGVDANYVFEENLKTGLREGQIIAIGTDGIWETFNTNGKMFGKERFREIIRKKAHMGSNDIIDAIYNEIDTFSKDLKKEDDITLVIIKIEETTRERGDWQI